jgi:hypothetical protein
MSKSRIIIPREVLLVEIERRCRDSECEAKTRIGLTKDEARSYRGFTCERCEKSWDDVLTERDAPDWWEDLTVTGLHTLRENRTPVVEEQPCEAITRMSDAWKGMRMKG